MKRLLSMLSLMVLCVIGMNAQTDVTSQYLQSPGLTSLTGWDYGDPFGNETYTYTDLETNGDVPVIEFYHTWNSTPGGPIGTTKNFHFTQTVTLPAGNYRIAVNALFREGNGNGTNTKAYIFAGEQQQFVHAVTAEEQQDLNGSSGKYSGNSDLSRAANAFSMGDFSNAFDFTLDSEQEIELGFRGYIDTYCSWCILGPVKLYLYTLEDYLNEYRPKVAEAQGLYNKPMSATVLAELQAAVVDEATLTTVVLVGQAEATLTQAITNAKASIAAYARLNEAIVKAKAYALKCYANGAPETDALDAYETAYNEGSVLDSEVDAKIAEINGIMLVIGQSQTSWPRIAPNMPSPQALESGKIYYLYNVGSDRFLTNYSNYSSYAVSAMTDKGTAVRISAVNGTEYTIQFTDNNKFLYNYSSSGYVEQNNYYGNDSYRFKFTETTNGYFIQRVNNSVENEYLGYNGDGYNRLYSNQTEGDIVWQLFDAEQAANFVAKRNLYRALEAADGYLIDDWELVYDNDGSSNYTLQDAADELNNAITATNKVPVSNWSDYDLLFYNGNISNNWDFSEYSNRIESRSIKNGTRTLKATVEVDDDATLVFNYYSYNDNNYDVRLEVYIDDVLQSSVNWIEGMADQRFFVEMTAGKHHITWKYINENKSSSSNCKIYNVGVEQTPTIEVSLLEPGSLGTEVLANTDHLQNVRKLVISGEMNDEDWARILMMNSIFALDLTNVTNTEIPEKALSRSYHAEELSFLHDVKLPSGLKVIGRCAFENTYIDEITFPEGLTTIGAWAFSGSRIKEAMIPETVTNIGEGALRNNQSMIRASFPAASVAVPDRCFHNVNCLQSLVLPEGITSIGEYAFSNCWSYDCIIPSTVTNIGYEAFRSTAITNVILSENVNVGSNAFRDCGSLTTVVLPTTYYDDISYMLASCSNLRDVTFKSPTMVIANSDIFSGNTLSNITLHVPNYLVNTYKLDNYWYNCEVVGFSTADIQDWIVKQPLKMITGQRFEGTPNVKLMNQGTWEIKGDDAMTLNRLETDYYNNNSGYVENMTSQILSTCDNITISGDYTHYYYTEANRWYFVTLPFDTKVGDISSSASFAVRYYDGANRAASGNGGNWKNYKKDDVIPAGTGFIFQTSKNVWSGFKAQDNETKQLVFSNEIITTPLQVNASEEKEHKGWNLVGNPWMTYYNIHKMNFTAPITTWDPYYRSYTAYSVYDDDYAIKPLEAFFVQCPSEELTRIEFPVDGRQLTSEITDQNGARMESAPVRKLIDVELSNGELKDKTRFVLNPKASFGYELSHDASKFMSMDANVPQIYTVEQGVQLAINERPQGNGNVQLGIKVAQNGTYTISAPRNQFQSIRLVDQLTNTETDLSQGDYTFQAEAGTYNDRFILSLNNGVVTGVEEIADGTEATANSAYDLQGRRVNSQLKKGLYIVNGKKVMK